MPHKLAIACVHEIRINEKKSVRGERARVRAIESSGSDIVYRHGGGGPGWRGENGFAMLSHGEGTAHAARTEGGNDPEYLAKPPVEPRALGLITSTESNARARARGDRVSFR